MGLFFTVILSILFTFWLLINGKLADYYSMLGSSRAVFRWFYYFKSNLITATKNIINARRMLYGGWWMIKIPLKLSSDFRTKQQEASPKVVPVVHNSPRVLEQNRNTGLFFLPKAASEAQKRALGYSSWWAGVGCVDHWHTCDVFGLWSGRE